MTVSSTKDSKTVLVLNILEEHFGDVVKDVAETIISSEHCTLAYLVRTLNSPEEPKRIDVSTIRQAMVILLHHNCLIVEMNPDTDGEDTAQSLSPEEKAKMVGLLYRLNIDNIMNRLRFCTLLKIVNDKFSPGNKRAGEAAVLIVEEVILHGRVRLPQIRQAVTQTLSTGEHSETEIHALIQETFEQLVQNRYIISVPQLDIKKRTVASADGMKVKAKNSVFSAPTNAAVAAANSAYSKKGGATAASLTSSSIGNNSNKRGRQAVDAELEDEQELLPVEMRMMASASEEPASKAIKVEPSDSAGGKAAATKGGRLGGRLGGRGGRGGRGGAAAAARSSGDMVDLDAAHFDEAAFLAGGNGNSSSSSSSSSSSASAALNGGSVVREDKMWMVCWDQLIREERHACCKQVTTDRMESMAGVIVSVILDNSMNTELGGSQPKSASMNVREILAGVNKRLRQQQLEGGAGGGGGLGGSSSSKGRGGAAGGAGRKGEGVGADRLEEPALKKLLEFMRLSSTSLLIKAVGSDGAEGGPSYMVNMEAIVQLLIRKTIHHIAISRYGEVSGRIVELLQRSKYVDQQTVSDMIILPARETRERLYKLYLDKWVNYLEMSKRGDFNPSSNYYFWYLDLPKLISAILDHFYKAIYNLRLRRADEVMKGKQLLDFAITNEADEVKYKALITRLNMLDDAVIRLDKSILVLEKF